MVLAARCSRSHGGKRRELQTISELTHSVDYVTVRSPLLVLEAPKGAILGLGEGGVLQARGFLAHEVQDSLVGRGVVVLQAVLVVVANTIDEARSLVTLIDATRFAAGVDHVPVGLVEGATVGLGESVGAVGGGVSTPREYASPYGYISRPFDPVLPTTGGRRSIDSKPRALDASTGGRTKPVSNVNVTRHPVSTASSRLGTNGGETRGLSTRIMLTHGSFPGRPSGGSVCRRSRSSDQDCWTGVGFFFSERPEEEHLGRISRGAGCCLFGRHRIERDLLLFICGYFESDGCKIGGRFWLWEEGACEIGKPRRDRFAGGGTLEPCSNAYGLGSGFLETIPRVAIFALHVPVLPVRRS